MPESPTTRSTRHLLIAALLVLGAGACRRDSFGPNTPARLAASTTTEIRATVGTTVQPPPTFVVRDGDGRFVAGAPVTLSVVEGGGTLANAPTVSLSGATPIGNFTLGTTSGRNVVRVEVEGVAPLDIVVIGTAGSPTGIRFVSGAGQTGLAGDALPGPVIVEVHDQFGNGVPAAPVALATSNIGASTSVSAVLTDQTGRTPPITWVLGRLGDEQELRATSGSFQAELSAGVQSDYDIEVRFTQGTATPYQATFLSAARRIRAIIVGDLPEELLVGVDASRCGAPAGVPLNETVDDVVIYAAVTTIDGPGKVLGRAGPCFVRTGSLLPLIGFMQFDVDDVPGMISSGRFESVVMHEMLHVLGVGAMWRTKGLLSNAGSSDPRFIGIHAIAACATIGFQTSCVDGAPVESGGGAGTADAHWRESIFDSELMTGFADTPPMPFSALTTGALEDHGYLVNYFAVDPFSLAALRFPSFPRATGEAEFDIVVEPIGEIGPLGRVRPYR